MDIASSIKFITSMNPVFNAASSSMYASIFGCVPILFISAVSAMTEATEILQIFTFIIFSLLTYSVSVIVVFLLALIAGSPIYYVMVRFKVNNYLSAPILGASFIASIFGFHISIEYCFLLLTGISVGAIYHYNYAKNTDAI